MKARLSLVVGLCLLVAACSLPEGVIETTLPASPKPTPTPFVPTPAATATQETLPAVACDKLAFVRAQDIYLASPDGSEQVRLTRSPSEFQPNGLVWSPDGMWIGYDVYEGKQMHPGVYLLSADGTEHRRLAELFRHDSWMWSPDSQYVDIARWSGLGSAHTVLDVETGECVCYHNPHSVALCDAVCGAVELSDGRWWFIPHRAVLNESEQRWAFAPVHEQFSVCPWCSYLSPNSEWVILQTMDNDSMQQTWRIARSDGKDLQPLTGIGVPDWVQPPVWYTDSQRFAIITVQGDKSYIWIVRVPNEVIPLMEDLPIEGRLSDTKWSANGQHLGFCHRDDDGRPEQAVVVDWPSGEMHIVQEGMDACILSWSPGTDYVLIGSPYESVWDARVHEYISLGNEFDTCSWSPDGVWLVCANDSAVVVFNPIDDKRIELPIVPVDYDRYSPNTVLQWSPGSQWLAITCDDAGIWIFDTVDRQTVWVTDQAGGWPRWSPPCK